MVKFQFGERAFRIILPQLLCELFEVLIYVYSNGGSGHFRCITSSLPSWSGVVLNEVLSA